MSDPAYPLTVVLEDLPGNVQPAFPPKPVRRDDAYCWICGASSVDVHCKIVCKNCGFMRDCSDP